MIDEVTTVLVMKLFYIKNAETHNAVTVERFLPMIKHIFSLPVFYRHLLLILTVLLCLSNNHRPKKVSVLHF